MTKKIMITKLITMTKPISIVLGDTLPQSSAFDNDDNNDNDNDDDINIHDNDYKANDL